MASGDHILMTFPFVIDNPDVREKILVEWHNNVSKGIAKSAKQSQKNVDYITTKSGAYISRIYLIKYADNFNVVEGKEFESLVNNEAKYKLREELITYALKADMPNVHYSKKKKLEAISTFKPFNIKELQVDVSSKNRITNRQKEFEQKGLRVRSTKRKKEKENISRNRQHRRDHDSDEEEDKYEKSKYHKYDKERSEKDTLKRDEDYETLKSHKSHKSHKSRGSKDPRRHGESRHGGSRHGGSRLGDSRHSSKFLDSGFSEL